MKTKRISTGYYKCVYRGIVFTVTKVSELTKSENAWYFQIGNENIHDWHGSKKMALLAAKDFIDERLKINQ